MNKQKIDMKAGMAKVRERMGKKLMEPKKIKLKSICNFNKKTNYVN